jgi:hypothetical protein
MTNFNTTQTEVKEPQNLGQEIKNEDGSEEESAIAIKLTNATAEEVQKRKEEFFSQFNEMAHYLSGKSTIQELLQEHGYTEEEAGKFLGGLSLVMHKTFTTTPKETIKAVLNDKTAKATFIQSVIKLLPLKVIPMPQNYYIVARKNTTKNANGIKTGEYYTFQLALQYQAEIELMERQGIDIIRTDYILGSELHEDLQSYEDGELVINHKPDLKVRKDILNKSKESKETSIDSIVASYVVYRQNGKAKYFLIDYEKIKKAYKSAKKNAINWGGTGGDGAKKTAVHRLFEFIVLKNIEDNEPALREVSEVIETPNEIETPKPTILKKGLTDFEPEEIKIEPDVKEEEPVKELNQLL